MRPVNYVKKRKSTRNELKYARSVILSQTCRLGALKFLLPSMEKTRGVRQGSGCQHHGHRGSPHRRLIIRASTTQCPCSQKTVEKGQVHLHELKYTRTATFCSELVGSKRRNSRCHRWKNSGRRQGNGCQHYGHGGNPHCLLTIRGLQHKAT